MLSPSDTAIVFVLALLLFGPEQLPKLARQLGEAMRHVQSTTHTFMQEMERAADVGETHVHGMGESHEHVIEAPPAEFPEPAGSHPESASIPETTADSTQTPSS